MQVRLPADVLSTLQDFAKDHHMSVSKVIRESMERFVRGEIQLEVPEKETKVIATSIYVEDDLKKAFEEAAKTNHLKVDRAMKLLVENLITHH